MKKKKRSPKTSSRALKQLLLSFLTAIILMGFYWTSDNLTTPVLPKSDQPAYLYSAQTHNDLQHTLRGAILDAKKSVLLIIYTLTDKQIIDALNQKANEGLDIRIIYDGKECPFLERKLHPQIKVLKRFGDGRMHLKILLVDSEQVWIGSSNMTADSLRMYGNLITGLVNPALGEFILAKSLIMKEEGKQEALTHREFLQENQLLEMWFLPDDNQAAKRIIQLINSAKKTVQVAMFTFTRHDFAEALIAAGKRGVKVELAMDHYSGNGACLRTVKYLQNHGIPVFFSQGSPLFHYKMMIIDDSILVNGSANWTKAAFTENDDCFIVLHSLTLQQSQQLTDLWKIIKKETREAKVR